VAAGSAVAEASVFAEGLWQSGAMHVQDPGDRFATIARELLSQQSPTATVDRIIGLAVEVVQGCDHAGISLVERRKIRTVAATDEVAEKGDQQQYVLDEGPCLDSIRDERTIQSPDLAHDDRWPNWGPWASEQLGVGSMLCFQLFTSEHSYGGLNLYSDRPSGFDDHDVAIGLSLAAHAAVAIATSERIDTLNTALTTRTEIGQAEGILMERFDISADQAFSVLVRVSQDENRRVAHVAADLVRTRHTPGS